MRYMQRYQAGIKYPFLSLMQSNNKKKQKSNAQYSMDFLPLHFGTLTET